MTTHCNRLLSLAFIVLFTALGSPVRAGNTCETYGRCDPPPNPQGDMFVDKHVGTGRPWVRSDLYEPRELRYPPAYMPRRADMFREVKPQPYDGFYTLFNPDRRAKPRVPGYKLYHYE